MVTNVSGPGGDKTLTLTGNNTGTFSGAITETGPGVINLYKDGTNLWTIQSSASTYTGTTIVNAGTLQAQSVSALGTGSAGVTVNTNGAARLSTPPAATGNFTKPITVSGPGTAPAGSGALNAGDNSNVNFTQPVTLAGNTTLLVTGFGYRHVHRRHHLRRTTTISSLLEEPVPAAAVVTSLAVFHWGQDR